MFCPPHITIIKNLYLRTQALSNPSAHLQKSEMTCLVKEWMLQSEVFDMATARGSQAIFKNISHPTKQMEAKVLRFKAMSKEERDQLDAKDMEEYTKQLLCLHRGGVFDCVQAEIRTSIKAGVSFSLSPPTDLKRWCYILYHCLGFNMGASLMRIQNWFADIKRKAKAEKGNVDDGTTTPKTKKPKHSRSGATPRSDTRPELISGSSKLTQLMFQDVLNGDEHQKRVRTLNCFLFVSSKFQQIHIT